MQSRIRPTVLAAALLAPLAFTAALPAQAQQRAVVSATAIHAVSINADAGLAPGSTLRFEVQGTPDARTASVLLAGGAVTVPLRQAAAGLYRGSYVVRRSDQIDAGGVMSVRLVHGDQAVSRNFTYPAEFQAMGMGAPGATAASLGIERFAMRTGGRVEPGRELVFRMRGTPGSQAWVDIPGVASGIGLTEIRPGVYEGNYTVRQRDNLDAFDGAVATLRNGTQRQIARLSREPEVARDGRPPTITELTPAHGERISERGRVHLSARLNDEGSGIDEESVRLRLDGRDVSRDVQVVGDEVRYREDLQPGRYTAELSVRDRAGNASTKQWTFDVLERDRERTGSLRPNQ